LEINIILAIISVLLLSLTVFLLYRLASVKRQLSAIKDALDDIKNGNLNRRILTNEQDMTRKICYDINEIAIINQSQLISQKQAEQAYKRLMTNLSHDVKTPLSSLIGYLEAIKYKIVHGEEKEEYIQVALNKAYSLKDFVASLFEWVKLDAGEEIFHFEECDINEISRNILADWITVFESNDFVYEIEIPENEYIIRIDVNAYNRIINNLLQNVIKHSNGNRLIFKIIEGRKQVKISIADNGNGIDEKDLPHIFERTYTCDTSRSARGNGLGLSISKELIGVHDGTVRAESTLGKGTTVYIELPKVR